MILILLFTVPLSGAAEEIYIWLDQDGVKHISTQRPPKNANIINKETFKPASPEEIRRYHQHQKNLAIIEEEKSKIRRQEAERQMEHDRMVREQEEREERAQLKKKKIMENRIKDLEAEKARLRAIENKDYKEARRIRLKREKERIDDKIDRYSE